MIESPEHFNNRQSFRVQLNFHTLSGGLQYLVKIGRKSGAFISLIEGAIGSARL